MIPCARESEAEMRVPADPYLWQSDDGATTAFARADCPTADDALWADGVVDGWRWVEDSAFHVRLAWCAEVDERGPGWWCIVSRDLPGAVWLVSS